MSKTKKIVVEPKDLPYALIETIENVYETRFHTLTPEILNIDGLSKDTDKMMLRGVLTVDSGFSFNDVCGTREECMTKFSEILDYIEQDVKRLNGQEADTVHFSFNISSCGYDDFEESCGATYEVLETEHEYQTRQLKLKHIPDVIKARAEYHKVYNQKLQKQQLESQQEFEKELAELKKKHGVL